MNYKKIRQLLEEIRLIGIKAAVKRLWRVLLNKTGLDVKLNPVQFFNDIRLHRESIDPIPPKLQDLQYWWMKQPNRFFLEGCSIANSILSTYLHQDEIEKIIDRGRKAAEGKVFAFRGWMADFGHPPKWNLNPLSKTLWPQHLHSKKILALADSEELGDIKITWEIGRFMHVPDIIRAYFFSFDEKLIDGLFEQIISFDRENPINQGPHWVSEQEVGIRACMLAFGLFALRNTSCLNGSRISIMLRQIIACAEYTSHEIEYTRNCIANNHLIAAALGMYLTGCVLSWHKKSFLWLNKGRQILMECLENQWYEDGSYIQPSHNYHRLALSYLLWVFRLAENQNDLEMISKIRKCLYKAFELLNNMIDEDSGMLPNWGPNDGAYFFPCTSCNYADFRPLLSSLRYAVSGKRQYRAGPWDEQLFWLWGPQSLEAKMDYIPPVEKSYPQAGLHTFRQKDGMAILRCGPILSRYGQQADQLHVDVWWRGVNVMLDAGSYLYGDRFYHDWFRSTDAHNTVVVDRQSQMVPYRQFLFLKWPNASIVDGQQPPKNVSAWYVGWHDGYKRLSQKIHHWRVLAKLNNDKWLIVDYLKRFRSGEPVMICQRWHFCNCQTEISGNRVELMLNVGNFAVLWTGSANSKIDLFVADSLSPDGWYSRYYGKKDASPSLHISNILKQEIILGTLIGPSDCLKSLHVDRFRREVEVDSKRISLKGLSFLNN